MAVTEYYGKAAGKTALEIFTENPSGRIVHRRLEDQEAYDTWHLSYYFKEVLRYRKLLEAGVTSLEQIERKDKNLLMYLLIAAAPEVKSIFEIGSSLFEMIDGLCVVRDYAKRTGRLPVLDLESYEYQGVELSDMLCQTSVVLHPEFKIKLWSNVRDWTASCDLMCDRSVTNYAFETAAELAAYINRSGISYLNTYFSKGDTFITSRLGKQVTYFSLRETLALIKKPMFHLYGDRAPGPYSGGTINKGLDVVEGFFLVGEKPVVDRLMTIAANDPQVAGFFSEKKVKPTPAQNLIG